MKRVCATIPWRDRDAVIAALDALGVGSIGYTQARLLRADVAQDSPYPGAHYIVGHIPQARVELSVDDDMAMRVLDAIKGITGALGRGQYAVTTLLEQHAIGAAL